MADTARTLVADLGDHLDETVRLCGWVHRIDGSGSDRQIVLRDHTGRTKLRGEGSGKLPDGLAPEAAIEVCGTVRHGPDGRPGLQLARLRVVGPSPGDPPVAASSPLAERLDWRYLDLREPRNRLILEIQTTVEHAMRSFWYDRGFIELHSPKLRATPNRSEGELFAVEYFDRRAYLAQSPQFHKQMAMAAGLDRVFEVGPVFRAQGQASSRHDTEFTSVDVEIAWIESMEDLLTHEEELLQQVLAAVRDEHGAAIERRFGIPVRVPATPFPRLPLQEAKEIVQATGWSVGGRDEDLDAEGERRLGDHVATEHRHPFVFITDYPELSRPFYHMRQDRPPATHSFDLLWRGLEITSGALREHRYDRLVAQARSRGVPLDLVSGYLDFFRYGCPPHGGFGLGLTRLLMSLLDLDDVREATYVFRGPDRLTP